MTARTLVLLRHAKAESPAGLPDDQRPLTPRGHVDARAAGAWLARRHAPDLVLCSPSRRTRATWKAVAAALAATGAGSGGGGPAVRFDPRLYDGGTTEALAAVREVDDAIAVVLVIGHNPGLSQLSFALDPDATFGSGGLRTCGLAVHEPAGSWRQCGPGNARLTASHTARGDR
jgi:phosphohistidine phosphatase